MMQAVLVRDGWKMSLGSEILRLAPGVYRLYDIAISRSTHDTAIDLDLEMTFDAPSVMEP